MQQCFSSGSSLRLLACAAAIDLFSSASTAGEGQAPFTEEAAARGLNYPTPTQGFGAGGAAFADLDNDGDADLVTTNRADRRLGLFQNNGDGFFTDRSADTTSAGMIPPSGQLQPCSPLAFDFDNDGDIDVFVVRSGSRCLLFRNNGDFTFHEVGVSAGLAAIFAGTGSSCGDYDLDGWTDVYVSNVSGANRLYRNLGNGTFIDVAPASGVDAIADLTLQSVLFDYDRDGDLDLYLGNDRGEVACATHGNRLFENVVGAFIDVTEQSETEACTDSMSTTIGDFDSNGWPDIFVTSSPPGHALLLNRGDGTFIEAAEAWGVAAHVFGWGASFLDFDNDSNLDLYICHATGSNHLYSHGGGFFCQDIAPLLNVDDAGPSFVTTTADIDDDGDLDVLLLNNAAPSRLFINHEGESRNWVKIRVVPTASLPSTIGATIRVTIAGQTQVQSVTAGSNFMAQEDSVRHFGLGSAVVVHEVNTRWPGGYDRTIRNLSANHTWHLYPQDRLGDVDGDRDRDFIDFLRLRDCFDADQPLPLTPGCEVMDYDGDGDVDAPDALAFLARFATALIDCNHNDVPDLLDILAEPAIDKDQNGFIDTCEPYCAADVFPDEGDGAVDVNDVLRLIAAFAGDACPPCDLVPALPGHIVGDGVVTVADIIASITAFGPCF